METVLIYRLGSMGDTVVALPCFHKIAATYPNARRIVITNRPVAASAAALEQILGGSGLVHGYIDYALGLRNPLGIARLAREIRNSEARVLIYLTDRPQLLGVLRDLAFFRLLGLGPIIGAPIRNHERRCRVDEKTGMQEPEAERLARCLAPLGRIDLDDAHAWSLNLQPDEIQRALQSVSSLRGGTFIAVHAGTKDAAKDWGQDKWAELLAGLSREHTDLGLVFVGAADEAARCTGLAAHWRGPTLNLCGKLPPRCSAVVLSRAMLFIGHDSGPMHLAASQGTRCVALFGDHEPPRRWHPYGSSHRIIHDMRGVRAIRSEQVLGRVRDALNDRGIYPPTGMRVQGGASH
jgi:heptosyltransferase III